MAYTVDFASADIQILEVLNQGEFAEVYLVSVDSLKCVMKVYHDDRNRVYWKGPTIFERERTAYTRLKEHGLCDRKIVPDYYGYLERLDLGRYKGRLLDGFLSDKIPPSANFIEYIPSLKMLDLDTYNKARMESFINGLKLIHAARVEHDDVRPRNMMISCKPDGTDRVIWMDFDRARTHDLGALSKEEQESFASEMSILEDLGPLLAADQIEGQISESLIYFCT